MDDRDINAGLDNAVRETIDDSVGLRDRPERKYGAEQPNKIAVGDLLGVVRLDNDGSAMEIDGRVKLSRCLVVHINEGKSRFTLSPAMQLPVVELPTKG